jgi:tetratricopeptide (TPR) repeat protein
MKAELRKIDNLVRLDQYEEALRQIDRLAEKHPREAKVWAKRSYVNARKGDSQAAIDDVSKAIAISELEPAYFYKRGLLLFEVGKFRDGISDFSKVVELCDYHDSDYYREPAYFFRAECHVRLGQYREARADCEHISDGMRTWTDSLRSKEDILKECTRK